jgi:hypothetical protein
MKRGVVGGDRVGGMNNLKNMMSMGWEFLIHGHDTPSCS